MTKWRTGIVAIAAFGLVSAAGPAAAQQPGASPASACLGRIPTDPLTLNLRDANVQTTLRVLAQQYRINMIVTEEVTARVTLDFFRVPARDVFGAILDTANLRCVVAGDVLRVSTGARIKAEDDERQRAVDARQRLDAETRKRLIEAQQAEEEMKQNLARGPVVEESIRLRYADAEDVAKVIQGILGLSAEGAAPAPLPQIYAPPIPVNIPDRPQAAPTGPPPTPTAPPDTLSKGLTVRAHKPTNSIFIRYYQRDLERIKKLISESLDIQLPQVQINSQMVIVSRTALEQLGIQWGGAAVAPRRGDPVVLGRGFATTPTAGGTPTIGAFGQNPNFNPSGTGTTNFLPVDPNSGIPTGSSLVNLPLSLLPTLATPGFGALFGLVGKEFNLSLAIQALETQGKAKRIAEPKIVTVENAKAEMLRGFEVPFTSTSQAGATPQVQFKEALLRLQVTPSVIREGNVNRIKMKVLVENNEPDFTRNVNGNPFLFKRKAETEVLVTEGQRLVIGGVTIESQTSNLRQVPLLSKIPVLGWLFKSREVGGDNEDLIVVMTPSVVPAQAAAQR